LYYSYYYYYYYYYYYVGEDDQDRGYDVCTSAKGHSENMKTTARLLMAVFFVCSQFFRGTPDQNT
jgi:hypothetical protein